MGKFTLGPKPEPKVTPPRPRPPKPEPALFEQLLPCTWRGIHFPTSTIKVSLSQDVTEHKYWGKDGADVESTGRAPLEIDAVLPLYNGIAPGKGEKWGVLYPTTFRQLLDAFSDKSKGVLQHPELGEITCKPVSFDFAHDAQRRDGVEVTVKWVETFENDEGFNTAAKDSPINVADLAALNLDSSRADLKLLVPDAALPEEDFVSLMNKVTGFVDSVTTFAQVIGNKPNQVLYRLEQLQNSVERAKNALTWPIIDTIERAKDALHDIKEATSTTHTLVGTGPVDGSGSPAVGRKIARFLTPNNMTASSIQASLPNANTLDELMQLNPVLVSKTEIGVGIVIRYYA